MKPIVLRTALGAVCVALAVAGASAGASAQTGPFTGLDGGGSSERIRCRATYKVGGGGQALDQTLRCASDSYKMDITSTLQSQGGTISGNWSESNRGVSGNVQGRASPGQINVLVEAAGFAANLTVATRGNKQTVGITSKGEIRNVNITMSKG